MKIHPSHHSYIKRADELEEISPASSFYCLNYVIDKVSEVYQANKSGNTSIVYFNNSSDPDVKRTLIQLLDRAESLKEARGPFELSDFVEFASRLLDAAEADNDPQSAFNRFFVAGKLFDVIVHFSDDSKHSELRRYAQFRALQKKRQISGEQSPTSQNAIEKASTSAEISSAQHTDAIGEAVSETEDLKAPHHTPATDAYDLQMADGAMNSARLAVSGTFILFMLPNSMVYQKPAALSFQDFKEASSHLKDALRILERMGY
ncbi:vacuolar sorting-associated, putative [Babesia ovata]|uniref:Vacuolar sorting-associated, putative n=1 Tax=Babesia ovata TaxID=189622 RepID=A0A2H6KHG7_9APIC|nr:vacuolar sorting-associated, putative [Babesia ovata]GBE62433.1 vacuolar sorting-associated, putative [Babesia ovata]